MIQVAGLSKAYGRQTIFEDVGFTINDGEHVGLVGRNGHGKTTLFRILIGEEHPDAGNIVTPNHYRIGHLSQHIRFSKASVLKEACLCLRPHEDGRDETYKVETVLSGLGFTEEDFIRSPHELSGGYQVRLNLAKVLVDAPDLLLLDEPTNYLDIVSIRWLTGFLRAWQKEMIVITHDRDFMNSVTTHTMGIHRCKMKKIEGPTDKWYQQIIMEEDIHEQTRINDEKKRKETEQFINRFRAQATKASAVQSRIKALQKKEKLDKLADIKDLEFSFNAAPFTGKCLLEAEKVSFSFGPEAPLLIDNFSLSVGKKDRIAIIGKNGRGKTTLLNLLAGELTPASGSISHHLGAKIAYFGQTNIERLHRDNTVEQEIMDVHPEHNRGAARKICGVMMFEGDSALKKIAVISGGEKSRVLLGKLIVSPTNLLLLDEPTNHLDMESIDSLIEAIDVFNGAVLIVTHSEMILDAVATRLVVFDDGKVRLFEGTYQDFLERVGWKDDSTVSENKGAEKKESMTNKKDLRRIRAGIITERAQVIRQIQKQITKIEESITRFEQKIEKSNDELLEASMKGDGEAIKRLSRSVQHSKEEVDRLFMELEVLSDSIAIKTQEFEEQLSVYS